MARVAAVSALIMCLIGLSMGMSFNREYNAEMVDYINNMPGNTWKAGFRFAGKTMFTGLIESNVTFPVANYQVDEDELPASFDARKKWPECPSIGEIKDQGACGSCWAVAGAAAISDRICIASQGQAIVEVSSDDILACNRNGCTGSSIEKSWLYFENEGVVSGGKFGSKKGCRPYSVPPCNHGGHGPSKLRSCRDFKINTPACEKECRPGYEVSYEEDKHYGGEVYRLGSEKQMMKDLMTHGPIEVGFGVFADFGAYDSGIYHHVAGKFAGGHAVKLIGWGEERGVKYWLLANSWNQNWGEDGFFRMTRGINECGIESKAIASRPLRALSSRY